MNADQLLRTISTGGVITPENPIAGGPGQQKPAEIKPTKAGVLINTAQLANSPCGILTLCLDNSGSQTAAASDDFILLGMRSWQGGDLGNAMKNLLNITATQINVIDNALTLSCESWIDTAYDTNAPSVAALNIATARDSMLVDGILVTVTAGTAAQKAEQIAFAGVVYAIAIEDNFKVTRVEIEPETCGPCVGVENTDKAWYHCSVPFVISLNQGFFLKLVPGVNIKMKLNVIGIGARNTEFVTPGN